MGQGTDGDDVDAALGGCGKCCLVDAAGGFDDGAVADELHGLGHLLGCHVVEHDDVGFACEGLFDAGEVFDLDFDLGHMGGVGMGAVEGCLDAASHLDVVVLDEHGIVEAEAVVGSAADFDGVLVEQAQAWRGLARVDKLGAVGGSYLREFMGARGDAREMLQQVQRQPLPREDGAGRAVDGCDNGGLV